MVKVYLLLCLVFKHIHALSLKAPEIKSSSLSRRDAIVTSAVSLATLVTSNVVPPMNQKAWALVEKDDDGAQTSFSNLQRRNLLQKIAESASDEDIAIAISQLEPYDPSKGTAATSPYLDGTWELIYGLNASAFSPLLNLPNPIRPQSLQLVGEAASPIVGQGRIAQILNFPLIPLSLILSSGAVPVVSDKSILEIFPPFRLEVRLGGTRIKLVESGSDADFRALNARDAEAQAAGRNLYKQRYLENSGKKGDLRISEVIAGDPMLVVSNVPP
jgi:hypothetical protein